MIHYVVTRDHAYTMRSYLETWGRPLRRRIRVVPWEKLPAKGDVSGGAWIFADLDRLTDSQRELASELWAQLEGNAAFRLLNHPARAASRYELLRRLCDSGRNAFDVRRLDEPRPERFPQFVRAASDHNGSRTPLLHDPEEVEDAVVAALLAGVRREDVLVVEHCDTAVDGLYRKYSAFRVGDRLLPRHVVFGEHWVLKLPDLLDEAKVAEELAWLEDFPQESELRTIFAEACIDYGRIDFGFHEGRLQVWEINTNPIVMLRPEEYAPLHAPAQQWFAPRIAAAFAALDADLPPGSARISLGSRAASVR